MTQSEYVRRLEGWAQSAAEELQEIAEAREEYSGDPADIVPLRALLEDYDALMLAGTDAQP